MGFLSKIELKKQLQELGVKIEGNYVRKSSIANVIKATNQHEVEKKKFITTVEQQVKRKYPNVDFGIDKQGDDLYFSVGDLVADPDRLDTFLEFMSDFFWNMKTKKTYQTIWPNWWDSTGSGGKYKITLTKEDEDYDHTL